MSTETPATSGPAHSIKLDLRIVCIVLLLVIAGMTVIWKPWQHTNITRKITIDGQATIKAVPDEFVFNPSFDETGTDITNIKNSLDAEGTKINNDLKKLGVPASGIQLDSSSYTDYPIDTSDISGQTFTLDVTITVDSQTLAQKVQDYLAGTDAKGQLTAAPQFSDGKQQQLSNQARLAAIADAKRQAERTADNLNGKLGKVLSVSDQQDSGLIRPFAASGVNTSAASQTAGLPVTPGKNDVSASVEVVYELN